MPVSIVLSASSDHRWVLSHYAPGETCRAHRHAEAQTSLLLAGDYVEDSPQGLIRAQGSHLSRKPSLFEHQNQFGDAGALILSVHGVDAMAGPARYGLEACETREAGHAALTRAALGETTEPGAVTPTRRDASPAAWLVRARDRLVGAPDQSVGALAQTLGRHPVAFARAFRSAYGRSPARYRHDWRVAGAIDRVVRSMAPLADVAAEAGFADQAHMTRAVRHASGWSPGALRRLFVT